MQYTACDLVHIVRSEQCVSQPQVQGVFYTRNFPKTHPILTNTKNIEEY
jgi:hypothetical protein